ncbi:DUF86 domain-containing protein [Halanaerobium sp. Z-7514]|uniref:DUF86 domain-containing protein n=1 Tax=Halanaerobium polyolivorans TaxID=2886943 RepID=A0AAW4X1D2_9FIRM|nr:DUF86 domain-containing protein [Halanaerobium polyolivorans]MCC3145620.1 DUF86 domain-containing protein [Halanaerobium polyolivorans]
MKRKIVNKKIQELDKYLKQLRKYEGICADELKNDLDKMWIVERGLQLSIQLILDIGNHILADKGISVDKYADIFIKLGENNIIPKKFAENIKGMAGFRNILVHEYAEIDVEIIANVLNNSLDDFKKFAEHINNYLENK